MKDEGKSLELGAVSSVVEDYLDTVNITSHFTREKRATVAKRV